MSDQATVQSTLWVMLVLQTIGSVDMPGHGARKMPSPRAYVAIVTTWAILGLAASTGWRRLASRLSILLVLTGAVLGPFGQRAINLLEAVAGGFAVAPPGSGSPATTPTTNRQVLA